MIEKLRSSVEIFNIRTRQNRVVWQTPELFEAPNWSPDGQSLLLNSEGLMYRLSLTGDVVPFLVDTGFATQCNNDHGVSPDGSLIAISDKIEFGKSATFKWHTVGIVAHGLCTSVNDVSGNSICPESPHRIKLNGQ